jgi:hypothetical protein
LDRQNFGGVPDFATTCMIGPRVSAALSLPVALKNIGVPPLLPADVVEADVDSERLPLPTSDF